jgi:phage-related protein
MAGIPLTCGENESHATRGLSRIPVRYANHFASSTLAKFDNAIYVLHVFAKKTRKASSLDVELGKKRYRELLERRK